jgi:hypothetical protein
MDIISGSALLCAVALFFIVFKVPEIGVALIPVCVILPGMLPRLFESIGYMELLLAFLSIVLIGRVVIYQKMMIYVDRFLVIMIVIAGILFLSAVLGSGIEAGVRFYIWMGCCVTYFLVANLVRTNRWVYYLLFFSLVVVVGMILVDFLYVSGVPLPETDTQWHMYRSYAASMADQGNPASGQSNFVVSMATMLFPVCVAYAAIVRSVQMRILCLGVFVGILTLVFLVQTRAFILCGSVSILAMSIKFWNRRAIRVAVTVAFMFIVGLTIINHVIPEGRMRFIDRFMVATTKGDSRIDIWVSLLKGGMDSPVFGNGALNKGQVLLKYRTVGGHGLFPQIFFENGILLLIPLCLLLLRWVQRAWNILQYSAVDFHESAAALASWGILAGLLANCIINVHLMQTASYGMLAFSLAGLLAVQEKILIRRGSMACIHQKISHLQSGEKKLL